jgi:hypothetical protein
MITGHNTDITFNGVVYHVQTEDKGKGNPIVETLVYKGGEILDARRTSYQELVDDGYDEKKIISLIEEQHRSVISEIKVGKYDKNAVMVAQDPLGEELIDARKSLDQVILDYLAAEAEKDHLVLQLKGNPQVVEGTACTLNIHTQNSNSDQPLKGVRIVVKMISTIKKPLTIYDGKTDKNGTLIVEFTVPEFHDGNAALLIQAFSDMGTDEIKIFVGKKN